MTISSSDALPARSPTPLIVHSTWRAPAVTAASVFATARPRSSWQCVLNVAWSAFGTRVRIAVKKVADLVRNGEADGVGQVDRRAPGRDDGFDDAAEEVQVAARRILGRELDVVGVLPRLRDGGDGGVETGFLRHAELALEVQIGGRDERVDAAARRRRERPAGAIDVGRDDSARARR